MVVMVLKDTRLLAKAAKQRKMKWLRVISLTFQDGRHGTKKNEMALSHQFIIKIESSQSRNSSMYHLHVLDLCNTKQKNKDRLFLFINYHHHTCT